MLKACYRLLLSKKEHEISNKSNISVFREKKFSDRTNNRESGVGGQVKEIEKAIESERGGKREKLKRNLEVERVIESSEGVK